MITLIIFLLIISSLIIALYLIKLKIVFKVEINNLDIYFKIIVLNKEFEGKFLLKEKRIKANSNKKNLFQNELQITTKFIKNIIEVIEIKELNLRVLIGALFTMPTIISTTIISTLIPHIYRLPFKKKGKLRFLVLPLYNTLKLRVSIKGTVEVSIYNFILILLLLRRI